MQEVAFPARLNCSKPSHIICIFNYLAQFFAMAFKLLFSRHSSSGRGATLLTVTLENVPTTSKPKHSMLPLLVVLFLISYGLLATLVVEQNRTISAQRSLLHQMLGDSMQLAA